ncbi:DUF2203 domain-containing protein [Candidatus Nitronereus thalassa]|uniref:DUF2203 domain-containing protein n=1 Tax=Candidatus Nitronereus thalassa TaxID=3020898 RepID=A0ABU3KAI9_9BACT|nr:DUF2203 domain-containing protein [Candidatus Nitronereus thalassa]MDT7043417.1 DUF2203 domain-containing protein [Candidatus Nitronereus thalassa]
MASHDEDISHDRLFTIAEATALLPQLETFLTKAKNGRTVLLHTKEEITKACAKAQFGGGSVVGPRYISALEDLHENLQKIQELGVIVKDLEMGLCDFPYLLDGRIVYLCWKLGEDKIEWWHEITTGFSGRQAIPKDAR